LPGKNMADDSPAATATATVDAVADEAAAPTDIAEATAVEADPLPNAETEIAATEIPSAEVAATEVAVDNGDAVPEAGIPEATVVAEGAECEIVDDAASTILVAPATLETSATVLPNLTKTITTATTPGGTPGVPDEITIGFNTADRGRGADVMTLLRCEREKVVYCCNIDSCAHEVEFEVDKVLNGQYRANKRNKHFERFHSPRRPDGRRTKRMRPDHENYEHERPHTQLIVHVNQPNLERLNAEPTDAATREEPYVVLCYGDSNTFGASDTVASARHPYEQRWTTVLQRTLGERFVVVPEGLNARTTVIDDPFEFPEYSSSGGEGLNGMRYLMPCLHSHKPVDVVVLALGCNDLKARHGLGATDIVSGISSLVSAVRRSSAGSSGQPPRVIVLSPPACRETDTAVDWGFKGCAKKSREVIAACASMCTRESVPFVDVSKLADPGMDGIHFGVRAAEPIGQKLAEEVKWLLSQS